MSTLGIIFLTLAGIIATVIVMFLCLILDEWLNEARISNQMVNLTDEKLVRIHDEDY